MDIFICPSASQFIFSNNQGFITRNHRTFAVQLFPRLLIHNAILFINTSTIEFFYNLLFSCKSCQNPDSIDGKEQNKKLPLLGIELTTSRSSVECSTDCARQESVGKEISEVSFVCVMHHFTFWTLFISRTNRA